MKALEIRVCVRDLQPAAAVRQELDVGAAAGEHVDKAVADHDRAAADYGAARDLHQAPGPTRHQRAGIGQRAADDDGAAAQGFDQRAGADRAAAQRQRRAAQDLHRDAGIDVVDRERGARAHFKRGAGQRFYVHPVGPAARTRRCRR